MNRNSVASWHVMETFKHIHFDGLNYHQDLFRLESLYLKVNCLMVFITRKVALLSSSILYVLQIDLEVFLWLKFFLIVFFFSMSNRRNSNCCKEIV